MAGACWRSGVVGVRGPGFRLSPNAELRGGLPPASGTIRHVDVAVGTRWRLIAQ